MCHDDEEACGREELPLFQKRMVCDGLVRLEFSKLVPVNLSNLTVVARSSVGAYSHAKV